METAWDQEADVVILGSGAAGLIAGLAAASHGAQVEIFEKAATLGGTTAISAGIVWVPAHDRSPGLDLPVDDAMTYLRAQSMGSMDEELTGIFVRTAPGMLDFLEAHTPLRFTVVPGFPDTQPELPGGKPAGGRSFVPAPFETDRLGDWPDKFTALPEEFGGVGFDPKTGKRRGGRGGATLVAGLLDGLLQAGVTPRLSHRAADLITDATGVAGVRIESPGGAHAAVRARRGIVIATGGFEWNERYVRTFLRGPMHGGTSPSSNEGDGLRMAMAVGAELGSMTEAWWVPIVQIPMSDGQIHNWGFLHERTQPRSIMVNRFGRRFINEAAPSSCLDGPFHQRHPVDEYVNDPAWVVFDSLHLEQFGAFGVPPGGAAPDWFLVGDDLPTLAAKAGIDPEGLTRTVEEWNRSVQDWSDPEFGRGLSAQDAWGSDDEATDRAKRTLGLLDAPPYYALRASLGALGTKGGPRTDGDSQVRHVSGRTIQGLYAAGNAMAGVTGSGYGGPGGTIGLALVWGYRAGYAAATGASAAG
jgi:3-oxosteroid 1-dehydrogenase